MSNGSVDFAIVNIGNHRSDEKLAGLHRFERAGMGKAPFRVVGYGREVFQAIPGDPSCPLQPGTSCDYCGTGIMDVAYIESSDGQKHKVGCDCVEKVGDAGLVHAIKRSPEYRRLQRDKRMALDARKSAEIDAILADYESRIETQATAEHFRYRLKWCGMAGRARILKELRDFASAKTVKQGD